MPRRNETSSEKRDISPRKYLDLVTEYLTTLGWNTNTNKIDSSHVIIACSRQSSSGETEHRLLLVQLDPKQKLTVGHIRNIQSIGEKKGVASLSVTTQGTIQEDARRAANEMSIEILEIDQILQQMDPDLATDTDEIEMPDPPESNATDESTGQEQPASSQTAGDRQQPQQPSSDATQERQADEMIQEQASLIEVVIMLIGAIVSLGGVYRSVNPTVPVQESSLSFATTIFIGLPALFVVITALDDYFNLKIFGSWRVRRANVAGIMGFYFLIMILGIYGLLDIPRTGTGHWLIFAGGSVLLFYSAGIYIIQIFFERRRGRR